MHEPSFICLIYWLEKKIRCMFDISLPSIEHSLTSIFIPPSCREIDRDAIFCCRQLIIIHVPQHTLLGEWVIGGTALIRPSPFETDGMGCSMHQEEVNNWVKNQNATNFIGLAHHRITPCKRSSMALRSVKDLNPYMKRMRLASRHCNI